MKVKYKHIVTGSGSASHDVVFSIDFNPIMVTIKYDWDKTEFPEVLGGGCFYNEPTFIRDLYQKDNFQFLLNFVCDFLKYDRRQIYCTDYPDKFDFKNGDKIEELLYYNANRYYVIKTDLRHALKSLSHFEVMVYEDKYDAQMYRHMSTVCDYLIKQRILTNKDYHRISNNTMDKFIKRLKQKTS